MAQFFESLWGRKSLIVLFYENAQLSTLMRSAPGQILYFWFWMFFKRHLIVFVHRKSWMSSICGFPVVQTSLLPVPVVTPTTCQITCPTLMKTWSKHWLTWLTRGSTSWSSGARAFHSSKTFWWVDIYCGSRSGTSRATKLYFTIALMM